MTWVQHAESAKEAYEQARKLDPGAQLSVSKVGEDRYLVTTKYVQGRTGDELLHTYTESVKNTKAATSYQSRYPSTRISSGSGGGGSGGGGTSTQTITKTTTAAAPQSTPTPNGEQAKATAQDLLSTPTYRDPETGATFRSVNGTIQVKPKGPYALDYWMPYNEYVEKERIRQMSPEQRKISNIVNKGLTSEEQQRLFAPTGSRQLEEQIMKHIDPYTSKDFYGGEPTLSTPVNVAIAVSAKVTEWSVKTFTSIGHNIEVATRPELYKAGSQVIQSGVAPFMAAEIAGQTMEYASKHPGEFIGQTATSALIFYGAGKAIGRTKTFVQERIGPRVAMATKGRLMGSLTREYKSFKPTDYTRMGVAKQAEGRIPAIVRESRHANLIKGKVRIPMQEFKQMIKHPGTTIKVMYEKAGAKIRGAVQYEKIHGTPGTVKRTIYTYVKETPAKGSLYKFTKSKGWEISTYGGRKAHIRSYSPIPDEVRIPAVSGRYDVIQRGHGYKSTEYGGFDVMLKKPPKTTVKDPWLYVKGTKPGPMKPFKGPSEVRPVSPGAAARAASLWEATTKSGGLKTATKSLESTQLRLPAQPPGHIPIEAAFDYGTMYTVAAGSLTKTPELGAGLRDLEMQVRIPDMDMRSFERSSQWNPNKYKHVPMDKQIPIMKQFEDVDIRFGQVQIPAQRQIPRQAPRQAERYAFEQVVAQQIRAANIPTVKFTTTTTTPAFKPFVIPKDPEIVKKKRRSPRGEKHGYWIHPVKDPIGEYLEEIK